MRRLRGTSPSTVIACIALFFAIAGGSAIALQGRNSVDSGDIKRNAVKTSDIANNAVTTRKIRNNHVRAADIQNNAVGAGEIRADQVGASELAATEPFHSVGTAGEPPLGNGGEGDCLWSVAAAAPLRINSPAFSKDLSDVVRLVGAAESADGPGGDAACGGVGDESLEDGTVFVLPAAYHPPTDMVFIDGYGGGGQLLIVGPTPLASPPFNLPAGAVVDLGDQGVLLDGLDFRTGASTGLPRLSGGGAVARSGVIDLLGD